MRTTADAVRDVLGASGATLVGESIGWTPSTSGLNGIRLPIATRGLLGVAVGMAMTGRRVVVELPSADRLLDLVDVLADLPDPASFRLPMVVRVATGLPSGTRFDRPVAETMASLGVPIVCGHSPATAIGLLLSALTADTPVVLLESRALFDRPAPHEPVALPLHRASVVRPGDDVTLVAWGDAVEASLSAADALSRDGVSAGVVDLVSLHPLDTATLTKEVQRTGRLIAVHPEDPGFAERTLQLALGEAFLHLESPPRQVRGEPGDIAARALESIQF